MSKRQMDESDKIERRNKVFQIFKLEWLEIKVETVSPVDTERKLRKLGDIFEYNQLDDSVKCRFCADAKAKVDFAKGKKWNEWKLDYVKRHLTYKVHINVIEDLRFKKAGGIVRLFNITQEKRQSRQEASERKKSDKELIKILIDNVVLVIKINASLNAVQEITLHFEKYVTIPESWRGNYYAFVFAECISNVLKEQTLAEVRMAPYHCLVIDESTDISIHKILVMYIKYRLEGEYKVVFLGLVKLSACDSRTIVSAIKQFYDNSNIDLQKMVMLESDGAAVMLGASNGVTAILRQEISHLQAQHCVAHREDLGIDDA